MSFSISRGNHIIDCNGKVLNSSIENSNIDMNGGVITSHGTPLNSTDVVNKAYVDSITASGIPLIILSLFSVNYTNILPTVLSGDIFISVKNIVSGGPSASFQLSKSESSKYPSYTRISSSSGINTNEKIDIKWDPGINIQIRKTGQNYDGDYKIKYILND